MNEEMMERKLLLLGLLHAQEMYGYQLNDVIEAHLGKSVDLKKPTVYKLLNQMADDGWLGYRDEQTGNRPPRRVYIITVGGKDAFKQLLRQSVADYKPINYLDNISLAFLDFLPAQEVVELLRQRHAAVEKISQSEYYSAEHTGSMQLMIEYQTRHLATELRWLDDVIQRFMKMQENTQGEE
jgi:DNA-binding PadR family transcriptional regulator